MEDIMELWWWKLLVPEGLLMIAIMSFFCALFGAKYGVMLAVAAEKKNSDKLEVNNFKSKAYFLLIETSSNLANINKLIKDVRHNNYVFISVSTTATDHFLNSKEVFKYSDRALLHFIDGMRGSISNLVDTNDFMLDMFKKNGQLSDINIGTIREKASTAEAFTIIVQQKLDCLMQLYKINELKMLDENMEKDIQTLSRIKEQLILEYSKYDNQ